MHLDFVCFPVSVIRFGLSLFGFLISASSLMAMLLVITGLFIILPQLLVFDADGIDLLWTLAAGLSYAVIVLYHRHVKLWLYRYHPLLFSYSASFLSRLFRWDPVMMNIDSERFWHALVIGVLRTGLACRILTFAFRQTDTEKAGGQHCPLSL